MIENFRVLIWGNEEVVVDHLSTKVGSVYNFSYGYAKPTYNQLHVTLNA